MVYLAIDEICDTIDRILKPKGPTGLELRFRALDNFIENSKEFKWIYWYDNGIQVVIIVQYIST